MTLDPDDVARAARRISAKMVADQKVNMMLSMVGMTGDPKELNRTEGFAVVVVAKGSAADDLLAWANGDRPPVSVEVEPVPNEPKDELMVLRSFMVPEREVSVVMMPRGSKILHVRREEEDLIRVYALTWEGLPRVRRTLNMHMSGDLVSTSCRPESYLGSFIDAMGGMVLVFDGGESE